MEQHALGILDLWVPPTKRIKDSTTQDGEFLAIVPKFLFYLIKESRKLGGSVLDHFWHQLAACNEKLKENIESLKVEAFVSAQRSFEMLFQGLDPESVDFKPVLAMAAEFFTHLGVAFMDPGRRKSGTSTAHSVSEAVKESTTELLQQLHNEGVSTKRKQESLKALLFERDGESCLLTRKQFTPFDDNGVDPVLAYLIPNSVGEKQETLECIAMFAGPTATEDIAKNLNGIGNVMNMQSDSYASYDKFKWGIEATEEGGKVKYLFRHTRTPIRPNAGGPGFIALKEGDQIHFGGGPEGEEIDKPVSRICNVQLAVARVMKMSAAVDLVLQWKDNANDDGCSRLFLSCEDYFDMLVAKLFLSGRAMVTC